MVQRPTYDDANLILRLYELRREERMRQARAWFTAKCKVKSYDELVQLAPGGSDENASLRMVTSYWDMAASFVNHGAIDADMFHDADLEHVAVYAKLEPFLAELRELSRSPTYLAHLERLVLSAPDAGDRVARMRRYVEHKANTYRRQ